jgi:hypothetical protein
VGTWWSIADILILTLATLYDNGLLHNRTIHVAQYENEWQKLIRWIFHLLSARSLVHMDSAQFSKQQVKHSCRRRTAAELDHGGLRPRCLSRTRYIPRVMKSADDRHITDIAGGKLPMTSAVIVSVLCILVLPTMVCHKTDTVPS